MKTFTKYILVLGLTLLFISSCGEKSNLPKAPDFTLRNGDGEAYSLSDFKGKMVILNFWATWCPPCKREIPDFIELYEKYEEQGLVILGVSVDQGGWMVTKEFVDKAGINYPIVMANRDVIYQYGGIKSIPTTYVINQKGHIAGQFTGYRSKNVWEEQIKSVLGL